MSVADVVMLLVGFSLIVASMADLVITLVATTGTLGRWRPTNLFYRWTWMAWTRVTGIVKSPERREGMLAVYGPASLLMLLVIWLLGLLFGWSLVWTALRDDLQGDTGFWSLAYYSGVVLFTLGFGDITPTATVFRVLNRRALQSRPLTEGADGTNIPRGRPPERSTRVERWAPVGGRARMPGGAERGGRVQVLNARPRGLREDRRHGNLRSR